MADYTLNIYGENDEIIKTYETSVVRWRIFKDAVTLQDNIKDKDELEQLGAISKFMCSVFPGLTIEEVDNADTFDIMSVFRQIINKARSINSGNKSENGSAKN